MHTFTLEPHVGVGPIKLGMTRDDVFASLVPYEIRENVVRDTLVDIKGTIAILKTMEAEVITVAEKQAIFDSVTLLEKSSQDLLETASNESILYGVSNGLHVAYTRGTVSFIGCSYIEQVVFLYAEVDVHRTPAQEVHELIIKDESTPYPFQQGGCIYGDQIMTSFEADTQYDRSGNEQRVVWAQIGLGDQRYLKTVPEHDR